MDEESRWYRARDCGFVWRPGEARDVRLRGEVAARSTRKGHTHPEDRYAVVVSGTFYHGRGSNFDEAKLEKRIAGAFFTEPAGVAHFGAAKDEPVILYFFGTGPDRTDVVEK